MSHIDSRKKLIAFNNYSNIEDRVIRMSYDYRDYLSDIIKLKSPEKYQSAKNILYKLFSLGISSLKHYYRQQDENGNLDNAALKEMAIKNQNIVEEHRIEDIVLSEMFGKATKYGYACSGGLDTGYRFAKNLIPEVISSDDSAPHNDYYSLEYAIGYLFYLVGFKYGRNDYSTYEDSTFDNAEYFNIVCHEYERYNEK